MTPKKRIEGLSKAIEDILALLADENNHDFTLDVYEIGNTALATYNPTKEQASHYKTMARKLGVKAEDLPGMRMDDLNKLLRKKRLRLSIEFPKKK